MSHPKPVVDVDAQLLRVIQNVHKARWVVLIVLGIMAIGAIIFMGVVISSQSTQISEQRNELRADCSIWGSLAGLPATVNPDTGRPSKFSVALIAESRFAYRGKGCGTPAPLDPSEVRWARYYHISVKLLVAALADSDPRVPLRPERRHGMSELRFVDAIGAGSITGGPFDGFCFYIGGDAYRVWPIGEVESRPERYRLPIWVRSNPQQVNAADDAARCIEALIRFGVPAGKLVALDSETAVDPAWTAVFVEIVNGAGIATGWPVIDYGSESVVRGNRNPNGYYWGAEWTNVPHLHSGDGMTQYISFNNEDLSEASSALPFWDTRPDPPKPPQPQEEEMLILKSTDDTGKVTETFLFSGTGLHHVVSPKDEQAFEAAGLKVVQVSRSQLDEITNTL